MQYRWQHKCLGIHLSLHWSGDTWRWNCLWDFVHWHSWWPLDLQSIQERNLQISNHCEFLEYWNTQKSIWEDLTTFFMSTWCGDSKNMEEIELSWWLFEGRLRQCKNVLPDGLNWLCYFAGSSNSHCENSISFIFLESPHQVDMKNVVKSSKHFLGYFNIYSRNSQCD